MMTTTRTNQQWLDDLTSGGPLQEAALSDLRDLLLRAALYFFNRSLSDFRGLDRQEILQRAEDCAQDALIAVTSHLQDFRGDSKFTTWAYKFAINMALMTARRERWKDISLDDLSSTSAGDLLDEFVPDKTDGMIPEQSAMREELRETLGRVIETDLTEKQRLVLVMMVFNEVPMDEVVRHLGANRNAVYKLLHDARRKLKSGLRERGFESGEVLTLFGAPG
jgi:RNA polymerase sigma-70 factor (ECF subfamily)